jgi:hypothetical protein
MTPSFVKLTCLVEYPDQYVDEYLKPSEPITDLYFPRHEIQRIIAADLSKDVAGVLVETILAANIARLGSLHYSQVFRFANSEIKGVDKGIRGVMGDVTDDLATRGWPTFTELSVQDVARWLYRIPGFNHRDTQTNLGRAMAAATYIITSQSSETTLDLVWALLGLEALYAHGNFGLQQQLAEKTEAFLGNRTTHKAAVSRMYDFRSRFLHGDIDLLYPHNVHQQASRYDRFQNQMFESENTAIAVLFATLQRMCAEDRYELKFQYHVSNSSDA